MRPWRLGMHVVCVDTNWHTGDLPDCPRLGDTRVIAEIDWDDHQRAHSKCTLVFEGSDTRFCDCHFRPAEGAPAKRVERRAPSPDKELEPAA